MPFAEIPGELRHTYLAANSEIEDVIEIGSVAPESANLSLTTALETFSSVTSRHLPTVGRHLDHCSRINQKGDVVVGPDIGRRQSR